MSLAVASIAVVACAARRPHRPEPVVDPVAQVWATTLDSARVAMADGRGPRADTILTAFRTEYAGRPQSAEALYWRALARLDLPAPPGGVRLAVTDLDAYRATLAPAHLTEAVVLRRMLTQLDSARAITIVVDRPATTSRAGLVPRDTLRAREEELQRTRADLSAAQAELDRVRRRLAAPSRRP
ncbi:MAG TPA: hypothetical protein VGD56_16525 [Gemmatirosa sp.]